MKESAPSRWVAQGTADIQIRGSRGRLVTASGNLAQWRRLECNEPLPYNPGNFKLKGIDGHVQQAWRLSRIPTMESL